MSGLPWDVGRRVLDLERACLMGIVNVTPDSFSDGGELETVAAAVERARAMITAGAAVIDIGAESTRPGAGAVTEPEQIARAVPVIKQLRASDNHVVISIDTTRTAVARAALAAGADVVNDVSAGEDDADMFTMVAEVGCGVVLMHRLRRPAEDSYSDTYTNAPHTDAPVYQDVVSEVRAYLDQRVAAAEAVGVDRRKIVIDPGLGFGKTVDQNYELIARLAEFTAGRMPVLAGSSRKSFIGAVSGEADPRKREAGSVGLTVIQYAAGVRLFRVHDVLAHRQALDVTEAVAAVSKGCPVRVPPDLRTGGDVSGSV